MQDKQVFQHENDQVLTAVLDNRFFSQWRKDYFIATKQDENDHDSVLTTLELFLTASCNQKCTYCYLVQFGDKLYPENCNNTNFEMILHNLDILINYSIQENYQYNTIDVFTGEILHNKFGLQVLEHLLNGIDNGLCCQQILWASNMSFILDKEQTQKIQNFIDAFDQRGVRITLSASVEGEPIEAQSRPLKSNEIKANTFYEDLFIFCKRNCYYYHPMISAYNVKWWKENYDWWKAQCEEYELGHFLNVVMALEVRNDDWTDEAIQNYNDLMDYMIDDYIAHFGKKHIAYFILGDPRGQIGECSYVPWTLTHSVDFSPCSISTTLCVRLGDLAIAPCHRTAYPHLLYGKFKVENDQIIGLEAINPAMAAKCLLGNYEHGIPGCDACFYNRYCMRGCLGAQQEVMNDPWYPIPGICKFYKSHIKHLIKKYEQCGFFEIIESITPYEICYPIAQELLEFRKQVEDEDVGRICGNNVS